jgi:protease IV
MSTPSGSLGPAEIPSPITQPHARANGGAPPSIVIQTQSNKWGSFWSRIGWAGFIFCAIALLGLQTRLSNFFDTSGGINEKFHSGSTSTLTTDKIAIITVSGPILGGDGFAKKQIERVRKDKDVKGVVLRIDSPGGSVSGSDYILHHLKKLRAEKLKTQDSFPLIVSMGSVAASGGYYVAMAVEDQPRSIYAEPTTTTGSIGVMIPHYDISRLMDRFDIKDDTIATHPRKLMLSMTKEMTPEERELVRAYIDDAFQRFKSIIKEGRPHFQKDESALNELATGEIFTATAAQRTGLIDEIGFIEDAIDRVVELARLDKEKVRVVRYESTASLSDLLFAGQAAQQRQGSLELLLELGTPRAYYLCTSLPPLMRSEP